MKLVFKHVHCHLSISIELLPAGYGPYSKRLLMSSSRQLELFNHTSHSPHSSSSASPTGSDQSTSSMKRTVEWPHEFLLMRLLFFVLPQNWKLPSWQNPAFSQATPVLPIVGRREPWRRKWSGMNYCESKCNCFNNRRVPMKYLQVVIIRKFLVRACVDLFVEFRIYGYELKSLGRS